MLNKALCIFPLGEATITIINTGSVVMRLSDFLTISHDEWQPDDEATLMRPQPFPCQCVHIALPDGASVLVDANDYALSTPPDAPYAPPEYHVPPKLVTFLQQQHIQPEQITHLLLTHAHGDHYLGVTTERDGTYLPSFPNARCYLGQADWKDLQMQEALQDSDSVESRTLGVLQRAGQLELVEGDRELTSRIRLIAAPGETNGHQLVQIASEGQTLYCVGDLYHHPLEVEHPAWIPPWANGQAFLHSREAFAETALRENALLVAAHIPGVGRLERSPGGTKWVVQEEGSLSRRQS